MPVRRSTSLAEAVTEVSLEISMYLVPYSLTVMYNAARSMYMRALELGAIDDKAHDQYADDQLHVDFKAGYFLTPELQLTFEAQNITDEHYYVYTGRSPYNAQYEEYGPTYKLGLTFTHF